MENSLDFTYLQGLLDTMSHGLPSPWQFTRFLAFWARNVFRHDNTGWWWVNKNTTMTDHRHSQSEAEMGEREGKEMATGLHDHVTHSHQKHQSRSMAAEFGCWWLSPALRLSSGAITPSCFFFTLETRSPAWRQARWGKLGHRFDVTSRARVCSSAEIKRLL